MKEKEIALGSTSVRAECTWGEGPDVLVIIPTGIAPHGHYDYPVMAVANGHSFGLRAEEARALAATLMTAATAAEELQRGWIAAGSRVTMCGTSGLNCACINGERCNCPCHNA